MAWSYRKRIKIIPGVHLNISKSGVSTSVGVRGANLTIGKSGTYLNTSIPGTGIYNKQKLSNENSSSNKIRPENLEPENFEISDNIFSADVQEITSQNMQGVKEAILSAHQQRSELKNDLIKIKANLASSKTKLTMSYVFIYGLIKSSISKNIKADIVSQENAIEKLKEQIKNCYVALEIEFDEEIRPKYERVVSAFKKLITSHKIWDVTSVYSEDTRITRGSADTLVKKKEVKFGIKSIPDIKSKYEALWFNNANGADLYVYPNFIVLYSSRTKFAIIGLDEIDFYYTSIRFIEAGAVPRDAKIIDKTWFKVNKNGSPDKRFKGNYQIPVVKYGELSLRTETGLNERYQFSNFEFLEEFGVAFDEYRKTVKGLKQLND